MKVTVFGATGVVGRALLPLLADHEVAAVSRSERDEPGPAGSSPTPPPAKGSRRRSTGADVVYYLVHSLGSRGLRGAGQRGGGVGRAGGGRRGRAPDRLPRRARRGRPEASPHLRSRRETGERLASAGVPVTTLRAAMIVGKGSAAFETILGLVKRLPVMITPTWVSTPTQPVALDDVARYLAGVCGNEASFGEGYDVGGPEVMTYRQMIERIARLLGRKPTIVEVPVLTPVPLVALARPDHARERVGRPAARRGAAQPDDRTRGADPRAAAVRAHAVRRGGPAGAG